MDVDNPSLAVAGKVGQTRVIKQALDLRRAARALDVLVGRVDTEDLLDEIFASFCIGK